LAYRPDAVRPIRDGAAPARVSELCADASPLEMGFSCVVPPVVVGRASSSVSAGKGVMPAVLLSDAILFEAYGRGSAVVGVGIFSSVWLVLELARCRCCSSFQPSEPNEPLRMSARDGALDAVCPVAAHMPGGGEASMSLMLAVRILLEMLEEAVPDLLRVLGSVVGLEACGSRVSSGCGKGAGGGVSGLEAVADPEPDALFEEAMVN